MIKKELLDKLRSKTSKIGVIGLGYVGLPFCIAAANHGLDVLGFDIDQTKCTAISDEKSYLKHISASELSKAVQTGHFRATTDFSRLNEPDILVICVPTPLSAHLEPDLSYLVSTTESIAKKLRRGQMIILESTTYPGTTDEVVRPILERSGLVCNEDFFVAFSPEREDPGNDAFDTTTTPKVVGADNPDARDVAQAFYEIFVNQVVMVSSTRAAEAVKLTENIFRAVNIALVNELKVIYEAMDVDIWEVVDAAKTKPFGYMAFYPGPGLGGHCIPIDPFYLTWKAKEFDISTRFIELAGQINSTMPQRVVEKLAQGLDMRQRKGLNGARILILGVAYKKNVDDMRESPALKLIELLEKRGAETEFYDPFVPLIPPTRDHPNLTGRESLKWSTDLAAAYDVTLIVTDHDGVDYSAILQHAPLVVDTRNACRKAGLNGENLILA
ncbi:MAG: nucleotide sugar dehydrogenase [Rhodobacteraceae bacterium]|nr:nucleotide sugar dehydrogenase [Paracoccaceae bacterium]